MTACMGPTFVVQQYGGPPRSKESVAILRVDAKEPARLLVLDGQDVSAPLMEDARLHIEVLPGRHSVVVANTTTPREHYSPMTFEAGAGRVYRFVFPNGATGEARVFEVGRGDNALIADVTAADKPALAAPPKAVEDAGDALDAGPVDSGEGDGG